jgi:RHS repeat-associated protein
MSYLGTGQSYRRAAGATAYQEDVTGVSQITSGGTTSYVTRTPDGQLLDVRSGSNTYYYLVDGLGSVLDLTNSAGTASNTYSYDPYGNSISKTEAVSNPFQYIGGMWDSSTGLYKFGARYYGPSVGRFTQPDPAACNMTTNLFTYADDSPVTSTDLHGTMSTPTMGGGYTQPSHASTERYPNCGFCKAAVKGALFFVVHFGIDVNALSCGPFAEICALAVETFLYGSGADSAISDRIDKITQTTCEIGGYCYRPNFP